jgi:CHAT domain-containing protein/tetratricopeptide (TPR) repeat protein
MSESMERYTNYYYNLVTLYSNKGDYDKAIECLLELKDIWESELGKGHLGCALLLHSLGVLYYNMKDYAHAEKCFLEAKTIWEKEQNKEHLEYAILLNNMGLLYHNMDDYTRSEECHLESMAIWKKIPDKGHSDYSVLLNNLGILYHDKGDYTKAIKCFLELKTIWEKNPNKEHHEYAKLLNYLGVLFLFKGNYSRTEEYFLESKLILEKTLGKKHPDYATSLNNLGALYQEMGNYDRAEECFFEAISIYGRELGKEHPDYATSLNGLGALYHIMGYYTRAEKCYLEAKAIREKALGKEHHNYATSILNLGSLYKDKGDYVPAEEYYLESKLILEKALGKEHPYYAALLNNLGELYYKMGDYKRADECFLEAISIYEREMGKEHIDYISSLENLSMLYLTMGEYKQAVTYKEEQNQQGMSLVNRIFTFLSGRERENYWNKNSFLFEASYSLSWFHPVPESNVLNYNNALFTKSLLLRTANAVRDSIYSSGVKELIAQYDEFIRFSQQIGSLRQRGDGNEAYIKNLEEQAEKLDKSLTHASAAFMEFKADLTLNWHDVQKSLQKEEAAVEFVSFRLFDKEWSTVTQYAALVLRSNMDAPEWIPLPDCEETLLEFIRMQNEKIQEQEKTVYDENSFDLYVAIWQPLEKTLENVSSVYYSPSGLLHKISFNAIPVKEGLRLTDIYDLNLVSSTREIVHRKTQQKPGSGVVYGGLRYTVDEEDMRREAQSYHKPDAENQEETDLPDKLRKSNILQQHWEMLPYMEKEGIDIQEILSKNNIPVDLYMDAEGNKESFKNLDGKKKSVLHLSTHGFFLDDIEKNYEERERLASLGGGPKAFENPLMLSGLLLAGCNNAWKGKPVAGVENGILFADDVARMDLVGAQLVVLSACDTGLGEVNNSEGVFGLQRAFKLAGAETLIMSLWSVNDQATSELMTAFYDKWINKGKSKQEAFKEAQRELRAIPEYSSPFYWAAFVMID